MLNQVKLKSLSVRFILIALLGFTFSTRPQGQWYSLISDVSADSQSTGIDSRWESFKSNHRKSYKNNQEESVRYRIFKDNLAKIDQMNDENEKVNGSRPFGVNQFADMDPNEFATGHLTYNKSKEVRAIEALNLKTPFSASALPTQIDWSTKGATTPIKDQGNCGSCWAFSATEQLETAVFMSTGTLPVLSAQQVTSCSTSDSGCSGGDTTSAYSYMINAGVQSDQSYPYTSGSTGSTGTCQYNPADVTARIGSWKYGVSACNDSSCSNQASLEPTLQQSITTQGPASVCLNATPWQYYTGGVLAANCPSDASSMNHCAQLVGYGTSTDGSQYWILRNQWGPSWGMKGFIQLKIGTNLCGVANEVTYVTPAGGPTPTPTITPTPAPTPTVIPTPTPTVTPTPTPTLLPPGQQETVDFRNTQLGRSTLCSVSSASGTPVVTCLTSLATTIVSSSVTRIQLTNVLNTAVVSLQMEVLAIRPSYYQNLTCTLNPNSIQVHMYSRNRKSMSGTSVCKH